MGQSSKEYHRAYYHSKKKPAHRAKRYKDLKCKCCEVLLKAKHGAHSSLNYCKGCRDNGAASRHQKRQSYKKHRQAILLRVKKYHQENRDYRLDYYKRWKSKQTVVQ